MDAEEAGNIFQSEIFVAVLFLDDGRAIDVDGAVGHAPVVLAAEILAVLILFEVFRQKRIEDFPVRGGLDLGLNVGFALYVPVEEPGIALGEGREVSVVNFVAFFRRAAGGAHSERALARFAKIDGGDGGGVFRFLRQILGRDLDGLEPLEGAA